MASGTDIRSPAVAGMFYPQDKEELQQTLKRFFERVGALPRHKTLKALIVPHAGYVFSGQTAAWGYCQVPRERGQHFVLIGPSHHFSFTGLAASEKTYWETPLGEIKHIKPRGLIPDVRIDDRPHLVEHSLEVQVPFLAYRCPSPTISSFLTGLAVNEGRVALYLEREYPSSVFIVSSDLSHYLPQEGAQKRDRATIDAILGLNQRYFLGNNNVACGAVGIRILLSLAQKENWRGKLLFYDTSATASGDARAVVGYASIGFYKT